LIVPTGSGIVGSVVALKFRSNGMKNVEIVGE